MFVISKVSSHSLYWITIYNLMILGNVFCAGNAKLMTSGNMIYMRMMKNLKFQV